MIKVFRAIWAGLIWLIVLLIPIQFYLAGRGAFAFRLGSATGREDAWTAHAIFGSLIGVVVLLAMVSGAVAKLPRSLLGMTALLFVLMLIQVTLAGFGDDASARWIAALHPVNGLILGVVALSLAVRARAYLPLRRLPAAGANAIGTEEVEQPGAGADTRLRGVSS
jgi:Family of unknown function (DUF6220)